jgi:hypothetical protein
MPTDVNGDNNTSPLDALVLINELERTGPKKLATPSVLRQIETLVNTVLPFYDVTGDGWLSPIDVLHVVNRLDLQPSAEGEYTAAVDAIFSDTESDFEPSSPSDDIGVLPLLVHADAPPRHAVHETDRDEDRENGEALDWVSIEDLLPNPFV